MLQCISFSNNSDYLKNARVVVFIHFLLKFPLWLERALNHFWTSCLALSSLNIFHYFFHCFLPPVLSGRPFKVAVDKMSWYFSREECVLPCFFCPCAEAHLQYQQVLKRSPVVGCVTKLAPGWRLFLSLTFPLINIQYQNAAGRNNFGQQTSPIFFFKERDMLQGTTENMLIQPASVSLTDTLSDFSGHYSCLLFHFWAISLTH